MIWYKCLLIEWALFWMKQTPYDTMLDSYHFILLVWLSALVDKFCSCPRGVNRTLPTAKYKGCGCGCGQYWGPPKVFGWGMPLDACPSVAYPRWGSKSARVWSRGTSCVSPMGWAPCIWPDWGCWLSMGMRAELSTFSSGACATLGGV